MPVRQALRLTKEATPAVYNASADPEDIMILRMTTPVTDYPRPIQWLIREAGSSNRRSQTGSEQTDNRIRIQTPLLYSQARLLLPAFCTPTGGLPGLNSFTADHQEAFDNTTFTKFFTRQLGFTPENLTLSANSNGQGVLMMADMTFVGRSSSHSITAVDFPLPALTDYDYSKPAVFQDMAGEVVLNGSDLVGFKSFQLTVKNTLDLNYDENSYPTPQFYGSRDVDWQISYRYKDATLRSAFEGTTAITMAIGFTNGTDTITFNLHSRNFILGYDKERPLDVAFYDTLRGGAYLDTAAGDDLTLTITP